MPEESSEDLAERLDGLEAQRQELIVWLRSMGYRSGGRMVLPPESASDEHKERIANYELVVDEIEKLRPLYISKLVASLAESSKRLEDLTEQLKDSGSDQSRSAVRLEAFTSALSVLTSIIVLALFGAYLFHALSDAGITGERAISLLSVGEGLLLGALYLSFELLKRRYRLWDLSRPPDPAG
jgi:hypothetical protein